MAPQAPSVFSIPAGIPFARVLARGIAARMAGDSTTHDPLALSDVTILVPTRRAARNLQEKFALELGGATGATGAALSPRIRALGELDEDEILFDPSLDDLELAPSIAPLRRRLLLAQLVNRWAEQRGSPLPFAQAASHAGELGRFLDEATTEGADLSKLEDLAPAELAAHWQKVSDFLQMIGKQWPNLLRSENTMEAAERRDHLLRALAARLRENPPRSPVIAAGSTGSIPATAELLKAIAQSPAGEVVLPGLDMEMDTPSWNVLDPGHAQYGLRELLRHIGIVREDVQVWPAAEESTAARGQRGRRGLRVYFLNQALRPPPTTDSWRAMVEAKDQAIAAALDGFAIVEAATPREEALVVAIALRVVLETPEQTAALVTPDRGLARRVAAELSRWDIAIDDSAGTLLSRTPPGGFLSLLAEAVAKSFAPVPLLALLKHPLAAGGQTRAGFRRNARALELAVLRGLRPAPGLDGIAVALERKNAPRALRDWFAGLREMLSPLADIMVADNSSLEGPSLAEIARAHAATAEALAATDKEQGPKVLWRGEAGEAGAGLIAELMEHGADITMAPEIATAREYAQFFRDLAELRVVRPAYGRHPRLAILGPLEARLLHFDRVVLGGLNEGTWPAEATTDPWLSRPMRKTLGLQPPERRIGLAAHDFAMLAAGPDIVATRALKEDGAPTTASRWLLRIKQLAKGLGLEDKLSARQDLLDWARAIDREAKTARAKRPAPRPKVQARPRRLRVTEIETWLRDPYAIYARHVLALKALDPIDAEPGPAERGTAIHKALEAFLVAFPDALPADGLERLLRLGEETFAAQGAGAAILALWRPRFVRAARWFLSYEADRRKAIVRALVEVAGEMTIAGPAGAFVIRGRADRIDIFADGSATIVDYKTGRVPSQKQIEHLLNPQLPLEAAMLKCGGFETTVTSVRELVHIQLTGGEPPGRDIPFKGNADDIAGKALAKISALVARYDDAAEPYRSHAMPERMRHESDYDHLARVREWSRGAEDTQ